MNCALEIVHQNCALCIMHCALIFVSSCRTEAHTRPLLVDGPTAETEYNDILPQPVALPRPRWHLRNVLRFTASPCIVPSHCGGELWMAFSPRVSTFAYGMNNMISVYSIRMPIPAPRKVLGFKPLINNNVIKYYKARSKEIFLLLRAFFV